MNDDLQSLTVLLAHAERQRDEALAEQLRLDAARRAADHQAEQLVTYRREYEQRWGAEFAREGRIELVHCYQGFMQRLTFAVEQQQRIAIGAAQQVERAMALVRGHDIRAAALKKLLERRVEQGRLEGNRHEQKQSDELAARVAWMRRGAGNALGAA